MAGRYRKKRKKRSLRLLTVPLGLLLMAVLIVAIFQVLPQTQPQPLAPNPYEPEDFTWKNGYLTCEGGKVGIDVSSHQGAIDWQTVADAGIEFVMIRVGYRGYEGGVLHADEMAQDHYKGAKEAGLLVGAYLFSQAITPKEAAEEARLALLQVKTWQLDLPLVFDWEYVSAEARTALASRQTVTACAKTFCDAVLQAGRQPMLYFNPHVAETYLDLTVLSDVDFWLALYSDQMTYPHKIQMWQYTQEGSVPGIQGNVDLNLLLPE